MRDRLVTIPIIRVLEKIGEQQYEKFTYQITN